jgi:hypothetical protein
MQRVLLAVGEPNMSSILRKHLASNGFGVIEKEVLHRKYLDEVIENEKPSILIIHDHYLESELESRREQEREILQMIDRWRLQYEDTIRVVYLCERERTDPFLGALAARNVMDIFHKREIPAQLFIKQLLEPPKFINIAKLGVSDLDLTNLPFVEKEKQKETEGVEEKSKPTNSDVAQKQKSESTRKEARSTKVAAPTKPTIQIHVHKPSKVEVERIGVPLDRKIIVVVSPYERSGTTFISHQLAYQITKQRIGVTYFENPFRRPYTYDRFVGHLQVPDYRSLYAGQLESTDAEVERKWMVEGVAIQALNPIYEMPYEEGDVSIEKFLRMFLSSGETPILIVDIGSDRHRPIYDDLLEISSHIVVVMDCDIPNLEWFEQNQISPDFNWIYGILHDKRTVLVANRFTKAAEEALPTENFVPIPNFQSEWIFDSQMKGTFSWNGREALKVQEEVFGELLRQVLPNPLLEKSKAGFRLSNWIPKIRVGK